MRSDYDYDIITIPLVWLGGVIGAMDNFLWLP